MTIKTFSLRKLIKLVISCAVPLLIGFLAQILSGGTEIYKTVQKPPLSPPPAVFPVAWIILYLLMGIAAFLIYEKGFVKDYVRDALKFYAIQLAVNFIWPIVFFRFQRFFLAFFVILILWIFVGITTANSTEYGTVQGLLCFRIGFGVPLRHILISAYGF